MYDLRTHRLHVSHDIVWLHRMNYQKNSKELVTNQLTVGNWHKNSQGTSRYIEVGEGISEANDQES